MTADEVRRTFAADGARRWSDIRPDWPDKDINWYYPGPDSGTFDYFNEAIIDSTEGTSHTAQGTPSEDDNILAIGVQEDRYAIGYFGFSYYIGAGQSLRAVQIDDGNGCVEPTFESALDGTYAPLSRPLFIYTRESLLNERPEVIGFIEFYLSNLDVLVPDVGYVTMPDTLLQTQSAKIARFIQ
jgi:phosphate transport system substrate-binding protein